MLSLGKFGPKVLTFLLKRKFGTLTNWNYRNSIVISFFRTWTSSTIFEKGGHNYQSYYKFLFNLFGLITSSFCFGKLIKIPENVTTRQSSMLIINIQ